MWRHQIFFFAFQHFHDHVLVEHDEKTLTHQIWHEFNTYPSWAKLFSNHKTYHIPSYYHQREKRSADFGFWPCDPPYFNTVFSTLKVRESEWPGGLNSTNSSKANQPMWSSVWPNQPLRSNQLINSWGSHNTHENQTRYLCLPRNLCKGYYIPISLCTKFIVVANYQTALVKIEK